MKKKVQQQDLKPAKDKLILLVEAFSKEFLNDEYAHLGRKMVDQLSRKRQVPYLFGRIEIWAGGIIHALGTINFLFDSKTEPYVSPSQIADYFGFSPSTLGQKGKLIRDMFKLGYWDSEFSTSAMLGNSPYRRLSTLNGFIVLHKE